MKWDPTSWNAAAEMRQNIRGIAIGAVILVGLMAWFLIVGHTTRAVYLGTEPGYSSADGAHLRTDPNANYLMPRNSDFYALKAGCRYDFTYERAVRAAENGQAVTRHVRSATLVDCP